MKYLSYFLLLFVFACGTPETKTSIDYFSQIQDTKARTVIKSAIEYAGGMEAWESIKHLRYAKQFDLLLEDGTIQKSFNQIHDYTYRPLKIDILSIENGDRIRTLAENGKYQRSKNDTLLNTSEESLAKSVNSSTFVLGMPFKLLDEGAQINYAGETEFVGKAANVIEVRYDADKNENHSSSEPWKFYFDKESAEWLGYWVKSSDHYNTVENINFERAGGLSFIKSRKSYRADSLGNRLYVRADYVYKDYKVEY